jgi:hypothetical protein
MEAKQKPTGSEEKQQVTAPMAMAELEIMKAEGAKSVADKSPEIKKLALLLAVVLGVTLFSQIVSYLIIESFDTAQTNFFSLFVSSNGILGITLLLIQAVTIFILLFTRDTSHAKTILLVASVGFGVALVKSIFSFQLGPSIITDLTILVVNFFILWKIFKVYLDL